jgi:hypothetical protein
MPLSSFFFNLQCMLLYIYIHHVMLWRDHAIDASSTGPDKHLSIDPPVHPSGPCRFLSLPLTKPYHMERRRTRRGVCSLAAMHRTRTSSGSDPSPRAGTDGYAAERNAAKEKAARLSGPHRRSIDPRCHL